MLIDLSESEIMIIITNISYVGLSWSGKNEEKCKQLKETLNDFKKVSLNVGIKLRVYLDQKEHENVEPN